MWLRGKELSPIAEPTARVFAIDYIGQRAHQSADRLDRVTDVALILQFGSGPPRRRLLAPVMPLKHRS
jgi:hypothetical protein